MYIIEKGRVHVCSATDDATYALLSRGDCFGESCLLERPAPRCSTIKWV